MNFDESVKYLYGLGNEVLAMKLGLGNITKLLNALGNPQDNFLKVQVAGTNGKGSTCAFLESICVNAGINVGLTTSPHLISVTERIKINGADIAEKDFARYATGIRNVSENLVKKGELETVPTYFEQVTAIALKAFADANIELAILETGLGGRFDATTAANAEIVAITPIDLDHQRILGNSLAEIAAEKAAIIRKDTPVFLANQPKKATEIILKKCTEFDIEPIRTIEILESIGRSPRVSKGARSISDLRFQISNFKTSKDSYENVKLGLPGKHQIENAKVAILLAEELSKNFEITKSNIIRGLEMARHSGRLEFRGKYLFDGAHNASGAKALREFLDECIDQPITMIFGSMRDKDLREIAEFLFPKAESLILTAPDNPRSMTAFDISKFVGERVSKENLFLTDSVLAAVNKAGEISKDGGVILITGSLYLIGEAQKILQSESKI